LTPRPSKYRCRQSSTLSLITPATVKIAVVVAVYLLRPTIIVVAFVVRLAFAIIGGFLAVVFPKPVLLPAPVILEPRNAVEPHGSTRRILHCQCKLYTPSFTASATPAYSIPQATFHPHPLSNRY
jgi:hypothetical protein